MKCEFIKANGSQCNANKTSTSSFCFRHDPANKTVSFRASQKGGSNRSLKGAFGSKVRLKTPTDVQSFLGHVINDVWTGKVPVKVGSSMGFLARCWLDVYEKADLETRVVSLEQKLSQLFK